MEAALSSEKFLPDYTTSRSIFKIWILIAVYFHPRIFLPELTKTDVSRDGSYVNLDSNLGPFQMRIAKHSCR
jgi:hypothetical protein